MSRSTSQTSNITANSSNGLSRGLSVKTNTKSPQSANPLPPSDIKLFVTNLRLLELDQRPDWPNITSQTFSSKSADQKQRISGVEWSLFRLFEIWDPEETSQKLQPFFPPLEPLQSLNLRAALYRCLNELKKNGVLGRESVLRKTMLDECKGERFLEVLALFSTSVLKKTLAERQRGNRHKSIAIASTLSTAFRLPKDQQISLLPLAIAHKAALVNVLQRKNEKRRRYKDFETLLNAKAGEISHRISQSKATPRAQKNMVPEKDATSIKKQLKDNWIGDQKWLDTMLHGDDVQVEDAFLHRHFDEVWPMVQQGRELEDAAPEIGLLENLQSRVQQQQSRLLKWRKFHEKLHKEAASKHIQSTKAPVPVKTFTFEDHLKQPFQTSKPSSEESVQQGPLRSEYQNILSDMDAELNRASQAKYNRSTAPHLRRRTSSMSGSRSPARQRKSRSESIPKKPVYHSAEKITKPNPPSRVQSKEAIPLRPTRHDPTPTPLDSEATLVGHPSTTLRTTLPPQPPVEASVPDRQDTGIEDRSDPLPIRSSPPQPPVEPQYQRSPSPPPSSYWPSEPPLLEAPMNAEDALAEQIISSIGNATPSPVKKQVRPSLLERTRLSMARTTSFPPTEESPAPTSPPLPDFEPGPLVHNSQASLVDRTRLSIANMSQKPRPKKDNRVSSSRQSLFPVNQFDTPRNRKSIQMIEEARSGEVTPKEDLFSDDIDYDRVFKSRPRVAQSPIISPDEGMRRGEGTQPEANEMEHDNVIGLGVDGYDGEYDEGVTGLDLGDVDAEDEDGFTQAWENSPSRKAGGEVRRGKLFS